MTNIKSKGICRLLLSVFMMSLLWSVLSAESNAYIGPINPELEFLGHASALNSKVGSKELTRAIHLLCPPKAEAIGELLQRLENLDEQAWILDLICSMRSEADQIVPELINELELGNRKAVWALGTIGPAARDAVPYLIQLVKQGDSDALIALGKIGPDAEEAIPLLLGMLNRDQNNPAIEKYTFRSGVPYAIGKILAGTPYHNETTRQAVSSLSRTILEESDNSNIKFYSVAALMWIGPGAKDAVPILIDVLKENPVFQNGHSMICFKLVLGGFARQALINIGTPAAGPLFEIVKTGSGHPRFFALHILREIAEKHPEIEQMVGEAEQIRAQRDIDEDFERPYYDPKTNRMRITEWSSRYLQSKNLSIRTHAAEAYLYESAYEEQAVNVLIDIVEKEEFYNAFPAAIILFNSNADFDRQKTAMLVEKRIVDALSTDLYYRDFPRLIKAGGVYAKSWSEHIEGTLDQHIPQWNNADKTARCRTVILAAAMLVHKPDLDKTHDIIAESIRDAESCHEAYECLKLLSSIAKFPESARKKFINALIDVVQNTEWESGNTWRIRETIRLLGNYGPDADSAISLLEKKLESGPGVLRRDAVIALKKIKFPEAE